MNLVMSSFLSIPSNNISLVMECSRLLRIFVTRSPASLHTLPTPHCEYMPYYAPPLATPLILIPVLPLPSPHLSSSSPCCPSPRHTSHPHPLVAPPLATPLILIPFPLLLRSHRKRQHFILHYAMPKELLVEQARCLPRV